MLAVIMLLFLDVLVLRRRMSLFSGDGLLKYSGRRGRTPATYSL